MNARKKILSLSCSFVTTFIEVNQILRSLKESIQKDEKRHQRKMLSLTMLIPSSKRLYLILLSLQKNQIHRRKIFSLDPEYERKIKSLISSFTVAEEPWKLDDVVKQGEFILRQIDELTKYCYILSPQARDDKKYVRCSEIPFSFNVNQQSFL